MINKKDYISDITYTEEEREIEKMSLEVLKFKKHI